MICSHFTIFMLNTEPPAQYITPPPPRGCKSIPSTWQLPRGFNEPLFRCAAIPLLDSGVCRFLLMVKLRIQC